MLRALIKLRYWVQFPNPGGRNEKEGSYVCVRGCGVVCDCYGWSVFSGGMRRRPKRLADIDHFKLESNCLCF